MVGEGGAEVAGEGPVGGFQGVVAGGGGADAGGVLEEVLVEEGLLLLAGAVGAAEGAVRVLETEVGGSLERVEGLGLGGVELRVGDLGVGGRG